MYSSDGFPQTVESRHCYTSFHLQEHKNTILSASLVKDALLQERNSVCFISERRTARTYHIAQAYRPPRSILPVAADELPNE